jgi:hypothetical protein
MAHSAALITSIQSRRRVKGFTPHFRKIRFKHAAILAQEACATLRFAPLHQSFSGRKTFKSLKIWRRNICAERESNVWTERSTRTPTTREA